MKIGEIWVQVKDSIIGHIDLKVQIIKINNDIITFIPDMSDIHENMKCSFNLKRKHFLMIFHKKY